MELQVTKHLRRMYTVSREVTESDEVQQLLTRLEFRKANEATRANKGLNIIM